MNKIRRVAWRWFGLVLAACPVWVQAQSGSQAQPLDACDEARTPYAAPLGAGPALTVPAQAHWVDAQRIRWPGQSQGGRFRLLHSLAGAITAAPGSQAAGFDRVLPLREAPAALPAAFAWLAPGASLALPLDLDRDARLKLEQGQLLLVDEDEQGRVKAVTRLQAAGALDALFADGAEAQALGTQRSAALTQGRLWAPTARSVELCLYPSAKAAPSQRLPTQRDADSGAWAWQQQADLKGQLYTYLVEVWVPSQGWVRQRVTDPYAVSLSANSRRSAILDMDDPATKPPGWEAQAVPQTVQGLNQMTVYELHVRDFSLLDPAVPMALRGKYAAFTQANSHGMKHLRQLAGVGVTDVHLLPVFDLATVPEQGCKQPVIPKAAPDSDAQQAAVMAVAGQDCFNWGYDPLHFSAPEGSYASDADDPTVRVREFRQMVQSLHAAGLRVGMDMVYNHTSASGQSPQSVLDRIVPGYYHRLNAQGEVERSTCCDNTATEHRMMAKLMSDSVLHWSQHYKLDSYRFDLMGHQPRAAMLAMRQRLQAVLGRPIQFIGEGWNFGEVANGARFVQASQLSLKGDGIGTFSDRGRDALRGGSFGSVADLMQSKGWINGLLDDPSKKAEALRAADLLRLQLAGTLAEYRFGTHGGETKRGADIDYSGQPAGYAGQPGEAVHYAENHDNHTLFDANVLKLPVSAPMAERIQRQTLANALVAWSQGTVYIHAGQELMRSKSLDRNSYDSGDAFNRLDYTLRDNGFAHGLPPKPDNGRDWEALRPLLRAAHLRPTPAQLRQATAQFLDVMRIRASSSLFKLASADEVQRRLRFHAASAGQDPALIVAELDGTGLDGANFAGLALVFNGARQARQIGIPGQGWRLHPVHRARGAADPRIAQQARAVGGKLLVPPLSAVVFVR